MEVPSVTSAASPSTSLTGSEQLQTEVEVFQVTGTEAPEDTGDDIEPELEELDNLSCHSSEACDCPAHIHDRDTPLIIDKVGPRQFPHNELSSLSKAKRPMLKGRTYNKIQ